MAAEATLVYRQMERGDETEVCDLVRRVFGVFVAPDCADEGIREFLRYVEPELLAGRCRSDHFVLVAEVQDQIVGMIEVRECRHVSLLFVDEHFHRIGIARELLRMATAKCATVAPNLSEITVNSSPYAAPVYARLGFVPTGPKQCRQGISYVPMVLALAEKQKPTQRSGAVDKSDIDT